MADFTIVQNASTPLLTAVLSDSGVVANLSGASVNLVLRNSGATTVYLTAPMVVTDATGGAVSYTWQTGDTAVPGSYLGEFDVTFADGSTKTYPTYGYFSLDITPALASASKPRPTYYTTADIISDVRGYLDGRQRPALNKLASDIDTTTTTVPLKYSLSTTGAGGMARGSQLSVGLETMYVWDSAATSVTVDRGADGTEASTHATNELIYVNPEFTNDRILRAINDELRALPGDGIYQVKSLDRTLIATAQGYDLATDVLKVVDVRWQHKWDSTEWSVVESWEAQFDMPTTVFPSGACLLIPERPYRTWPNNVFANDGTTNRSLRIRYFAPLGTLTTLFDDVLNVTGIPSTALDVIAIGAALRLMSGRPIQRVTTLGQPDSRNAAEVKAADVLNAPAALRQLRENRITQEAAQLNSSFTYRKPVRRLMA